MIFPGEVTPPFQTPSSFFPSFLCTRSAVTHLMWPASSCWSGKWSRVSVGSCRDTAGEGLIKKSSVRILSAPVGIPPAGTGAIKKSSAQIKLLVLGFQEVTVAAGSVFLRVTFLGETNFTHLPAPERKRKAIWRSGRGLLPLVRTLGVE